MKLTAQIKVVTTPEDHAALLETMVVFNRACQYIADYAFEHKVFNNCNLHKLLYYEVRAKFCLPSQLTVRAFAKVADAYHTSLTHLKTRQAKYDALPEAKRAKRKRPELRVCRFRDKGAVVYDVNLLTYERGGDTRSPGEEGNTISIRTMKRRLKQVSVQFPKGLDRTNIRGEADLVLQGNVFYLLQTIEIEALPPYATTTYLGVDLGMVHLAYDSDGNIYNDPGIEKKRVMYEVRRTNLKKTKTKNSRRRLKKMGKKLARFRKDVNHCISKALVSQAKALGIGLAMEYLVDFFSVNSVGRKNRAARRSWAFYQLRAFCIYKAIRDGVPVALVEAAFSSQECSKCHYIDPKNRPSQAKFQCRNPECGHTDNADHNSAEVVKFRAENQSTSQIILLAEYAKRRQQKATASLSAPGLCPGAPAASHTPCGCGS